MTLRCVLPAAALCGLLVGSTVAADWPQWRGPNRDGKSADTGLLKEWPKDGPNLAWSITKLDVIGTGYGSPAVVGERVYLLGGEGKEGQKASGEEFLTCLSVKDGSVVWKSPLGTSSGSFGLQGWGRGPRGTPTVDGDKIYVIGVMGDLVCFTTDGKAVWKKNFKSDFGGVIPQWGYSESPLVDGDKVVVTPGAKGGVVALNKATGATVWQCSESVGPAGYSSLIAADVHGVRQYITQTMAQGVGVRASDGKLLWTASQMKRSVAVIPTAVYADGLVFFTNGYTNGCELYRLEPDGTDGTKATLVYASKDAMSNHHGQVILLDGYLYGHTDHNMSGSSDRGKGTWECLPFKVDSEPSPKWRSNKLEKGSITYADGHFYCYGEDKGTLVRISATPEGWQEAGRFDIPKTSPIRPKQGHVWSIPVVANGKLYLRDYELLYVYDLK